MSVDVNSRMPWFWAKLGKATWPDTYHPVICHLIDVGQVAFSLWNSALRKPIRERLTVQLGLESTEDAGRWLAFWIGAHDIGKVTPCFQFQGKTTNLGRRLAAVGFGTGTSAISITR